MEERKNAEERAKYGSDGAREDADGDCTKDCIVNIIDGSLEVIFVTTLVVSYRRHATLH